MLAKIIQNKKKKSSFTRLISYISTRDDSYINHIHEYELENVSNIPLNSENYLPSSELDELLNINEKIISKTGVACKHNCISLETASKEMQAVTANNSRVKDPVYHFLISWKSHENPTDDQMFACADYCLRKLKMDEHQHVFAIHRDTDNCHVHICVNRIHPETFKAQSISHDYFKLDKAMRELELKYGWESDNGPFTIKEDGGNKIIDWSNNISHIELKKTPIPIIEKYSGTESFYQYLQGQPSIEIKKLLKSKNLTWNSLHIKLAEFGVKIAPKGQGLAIFNDDMSIAIKASSLSQNLSKGKIEKRLGEYRPFSEFMFKQYKQTSYDKFNPSLNTLKRDPFLRQKRKEERAEARRKLIEEYKSYRKKFVTQRITNQEVINQLKNITQEAKDLRLLVRNRMPGNTTEQKNMRFAFYSVIAFEAAKKKEKLLNEIALKRKALAKDPKNKRLSYKDWVSIEAKKGNEVAISQLRGFYYADQKAIKRKNGFLGALTNDIDDSGKGNHISLNTQLSKSDEAILHALLNAKHQYSGKLELTGTDEFKQRVIRLVIRNSIDIDFMNSAQKSMYEQFLKEQRERNQRNSKIKNN